MAESAQDAGAGRLVEAWASGLMARLGRLAKDLVVTTAPVHGLEELGQDTGHRLA